jgi:hypothetical protein
VRKVVVLNEANAIATGPAVKKATAMSAVSVATAAMVAIPPSSPVSPKSPAVADTAYS